MAASKKTVGDLIMEYFKAHPNQDLEHAPVVDYVIEKYSEQRGSPPRDPWRNIRNLYQKGILIQVRKGVYRYDPDYQRDVILWNFDSKTKELILKRDGYKCVVCGRGRSDGVELTIDHKKPRDKGGDSSFDNGQTLCTEHNLLKKNYSRTEAGKRYFIQLYEDAVKVDDKKMVSFCDDVFDVYDNHGIDEHIKRP